MSEHMNPIPSRIYNAAVGGHVAGADQIIDDNENKEQSQINAEVKQALDQGGSVDTRINQAKTDIIGGASSNGNTLKKIEDRVSPLESAVGSGGSIDARIADAKAEIKGNATSACDTLGEAEALISAEKTRAQGAEENLRTLYNNLQQSQPIPVTSLPATGEAGKIYRLAGTTSYSDYMWNGSSFVLMATYNNAIDNNPIPASDNLAKSSGIAFKISDSLNMSKIIKTKNDYIDFYNQIDGSGEGRLRITYEIKANTRFELRYPNNPGLVSALFESIDDSRIFSNSIESYQASYNTQVLTGVTTQDGYLNVSTKKPDNSPISSSEAQNMFNNIYVAIYDNKVRNELINVESASFSDIYHKDSFDNIRVDVITGEESVTGERIRNILQISTKSYVYASCGFGKGVTITLHDNYNDAKRAANPIESITNGYIHSASGKFSKDGYICISLCKDDESSITDGEMSNFISALDILVYEIGEVEQGLPVYWKSYLQNKLDVLNQADANLGRNGVSFAFITDIHVDANARHSPSLLKWIKENTNVRKVVCGGDLLYDDLADTSKNTKANAIKQLGWWKEATSGLDIVNIRGNHDSNEEYPATAGSTVTLGEFYGEENRQSENYVKFVSNHLYGYEDNESQKVRYIYLDALVPHTTVIDDDQINWMKARIQELGTGWTVVLFVHDLWIGAENQQIEYTADGEKIVNALDLIYDTIDCKIACVISGHAHVDFNQTSAKGIVLISTTTDTMGWNASFYDWNYPNRVAGTTTEQCFDLFYIDTENRTIKTIRIGAGDTTGNRAISY